MWFKDRGLGSNPRTLARRAARRSSAAPARTSGVRRAARRCSRECAQPPPSNAVRSAPRTHLGGAASGPAFIRRPRTHLRGAASGPRSLRSAAALGRTSVARRAARVHPPPWDAHLGAPRRSSRGCVQPLPWDAMVLAGLLNAPATGAQACRLKTRAKNIVGNRVQVHRRGPRVQEHRR